MAVLFYWIRWYMAKFFGQNMQNTNWDASASWPCISISLGVLEFKNSKLVVVFGIFEHWRQFSKHSCIWWEGWCPLLRGILDLPLGCQGCPRGPNSFTSIFGVGAPPRGNPGSATEAFMWPWIFWAYKKFVLQFSGIKFVTLFAHCSRFEPKVWKWTLSQMLNLF